MSKDRRHKLINKEVRMIPFELNKVYCGYL